MMQLALLAALAAAAFGVGGMTGAEAHCVTAPPPATADALAALVAAGPAGAAAAAAAAGAARRGGGAPAAAALGALRTTGAAQAGGLAGRAGRPAGGARAPRRGGGGGGRGGAGRGGAGGRWPVGGRGAPRPAANATTLAELVQVLDVACAAAFPNSNDSLALCEALAKDAANLLPWIVQQLNTLAWDIPLGFCSVFLPVCSNPCCDTPYTPNQLHLALADDPAAMSITWVTLNETATSTVAWGAAGGPLTLSAAGSSRTYSFAGWLGVVHTATMTGLAAGTKYSYRVGDAAGGWSDVWNFTTLPSNLGTPARPFRIVQVADMSYDNQSDATVASITALVDAGQVDVLLHPGDGGYADGFAPHWDAFFTKIQPIAARVPYMSGPGNHELWDNFVDYKMRYTMPSFNATQNMYYSWNSGPVHFLSINPETAIDTADVDATQLAWIQADLAAVNRSATPWVIAMGHRPLYCSNNDKVQCGLFAAILRYQVEAVLYNAKVDVVVRARGV